jgi:hypothetical protein
MSSVNDYDTAHHTQNDEYPDDCNIPVIHKLLPRFAREASELGMQVYEDRKSRKKANGQHVWPLPLEIAMIEGAFWISMYIHHCVY